MTELEMFQKLFSQCSIWRGGCHAPTSDGSNTTLRAHIAIKLKNGKTDYIEANFIFSEDGRWVDTRKA